jgi:hypothetical protein
MTQDEIIEMGKQVGLWPAVTDIFAKELEAFAKLVAAKEREACAHKVEEFANLHYSSTLRAHQDFCALQADIRARGEQA